MEDFSMPPKRNELSGAGQRNSLCLPWVIHGWLLASKILPFFYSLTWKKQLSSIQAASFPFLFVFINTVFYRIRLNSGVHTGTVYIKTLWDLGQFCCTHCYRTRPSEQKAAIQFSGKNWLYKDGVLLRMLCRYFLKCLSDHHGTYNKMILLLGHKGQICCFDMSLIKLHHTFIHILFIHVLRWLY